VSCRVGLDPNDSGHGEVRLSACRASRSRGASWLVVDDVVAE